MAQKDLLQRKEFVDLLESIITHKIEQNEGLSLAIDGKWGCGKSFILEMLESRLRAKKCLVIHYNCWSNDFYDEPLVALLATIADTLYNEALGRMLDAESNWKEKIKVAEDFLASAGAILFEHKFGLNAKELIDSGKKALAGERTANLLAGIGPFDPNRSLKAAIESIRKAFHVFKQAGVKIVIVVDELDRCLPEYAIKVLSRLHHICFDPKAAKPIFIQLVAMNKDEMACSIAKVFGHHSDGKGQIHFAPSQQGAFPQSATIREDDSYQDRRMFANYYFQKFIQMTIPVPEGKTAPNDLALLNGFERQFNETKPVTRAYVAQFLSNVLAQIPMRIRLEYIESIKTIHNIALGRCGSKNLSFGTLGVELVDCLFRCVLNLPAPRVTTLNGESCETSFSFKQIHLEFIDSPNAFAKALIEWSKSRCSFLQGINSPDRCDHRLNEPFNDPASYIKASYIDSQNPNDLMNAKDIAEDDKAFIAEFRKVLDAVMPL